MSPVGLVLSCEHASARVPRELKRWFLGYEPWLLDHRGSDLGARHLARALARAFSAPCVEGTHTRLVVDLNRSKDHPRLLGAPLRRLPRAQRAALRERWIAELWEPFRRATEAQVRRRARARGGVLHLSVHSFTPVLDGRRRDMDLAVLYDPSREIESNLARAWADALRERSGLRVARNRPYRGTADGHTTALRRRISPNRYHGIELEVNQALARGQRFPGPLVEAIRAALADVLGRR